MRVIAHNTGKYASFKRCYLSKDLRKYCSQFGLINESGLPQGYYTALEMYDIHGLISMHTSVAVLPKRIRF